jgi:hypothetical protein
MYTDLLSNFTIKNSVLGSNKAEETRCNARTSPRSIPDRYHRHLQATALQRFDRQFHKRLLSRSGFGRRRSSAALRPDCPISWLIQTLPGSPCLSRTTCHPEPNIWQRRQEPRRILAPRSKPSSPFSCALLWLSRPPGSGAAGCMRIFIHLAPFCPEVRKRFEIINERPCSLQRCCLFVHPDGASLHHSSIPLFVLCICFPADNKISLLKNR